MGGEITNLFVLKGATKPNVPPERNLHQFMAEKFKFYRRSLKSL